jgi:predicted nucleic acid-binding protein
MPQPRKALFWDSCVFYRYLTEIPNECVEDIVQYIRSAQRGDIDIIFSTITLAEIRPSSLRQKGYDGIDEFFDDFNSVFLPIGPTPEIMKRAAILKDRKYRHSRKDPRHMGTPDAIQLLTCLHAAEDLGYAEVIFHTFDNGGGKGWEGKCVPLLSFEEWISGCEDEPLIAKVAALTREKPLYPEPMLPDVA